LALHEITLSPGGSGLAEITDDPNLNRVKQMFSILEVVPTVENNECNNDVASRNRDLPRIDDIAIL
jgi:hypothetical protein